MTRHHRPIRVGRKLAAGCALLLLAANASAQAPSPTTVTTWTPGTTLFGFVGAATASSDADLMAGLGLGWEIAPHFTLEGRGTWFRPGHRAKAYSAALDVLVPLVHTRPVAPFVAAGVGVQRATFSDISNLPAFYERRLTAAARARGGAAFSDVMLAFGGGADFFVTSHLALRPEVSVRLITTRSDVWMMPIYGIHLAYHFETHPVLR